MDIDEPLPHGENTQIEISTYITDFDKGVHPVTLELYSGELYINDKH